MSAPANIPQTMEVQDIFQPRAIIDSSNEQLALLYKELHWIASGRTGPHHSEVYISGVVDDELTHPNAEFIAVADYNNSGGDVTFKGKRLKYMGYAPIINCSIYRNPEATVKLYENDPLEISVEPAELQVPETPANPNPNHIFNPVTPTPSVPVIEQDTDEDEG